MTDCRFGNSARPKVAVFKVILNGLLFSSWPYLTFLVAAFVCLLVRNFRGLEAKSLESGDVRVELYLLPEDDIWVMLGGDHGGDSYKFCF